MLGKLNLEQLSPTFDSPNDSEIWLSTYGNKYFNLMIYMLITMPDSRVTKFALYNEITYPKYIELETHLKRFVDQPLFQIQFFCEEELNLHFGEPKPYSSLKMKHKFEESFTITTGASCWYFIIKQAEVTQVILDTNHHKTTPLASHLQPLTKKELEAQTYVKPGEKLKDVFLIEVVKELDFDREVSGLGFCLCLDNTYFPGLFHS